MAKDPTTKEESDASLPIDDGYKRPGGKNDVSDAIAGETAMYRAINIYVKNHPELASKELQAYIDHPTQATLDGMSKKALAELDALQFRIRKEQVAHPPENYTIFYYMVDKTTAAIPSMYDEVYRHAINAEDKPYIRDDNPVVPLNEKQQHAVAETISIYERQTNGRFHFVRVDDPAKANLFYAGAKELGGSNGAAEYSSGLVLLADSGGDLKTIIHETGHALGLDHPRDTAPGKVATNSATYYQTIMTYNGYSMAAGGPRMVAGDPVQLMPSDITALKRLYPVRADRDGHTSEVTMGQESQSEGFRASVRHKEKSESVRFNKEGIGYQPMHDTPEDQLYLNSPSKADAPLTGMNGEYESSFRANIRQVFNGLEISGPYQKSTTFLPIHAESIIRSSGAEYIELGGNVTVATGSPNTANRFADKNEFKDEIAVNGENNRIIMAASEFDDKGTLIYLRPGSETKVTITHVEDIKNFTVAPDFRASRNGLPNLTLSGSKDQKGDYHISMTESDGRSTKLTIHLATTDPMARAKFEAVLHKEGLYFLSNADGEINVLQALPELPEAAKNAPGNGLPPKHAAQDNAVPTR